MKIAHFLVLALTIAICSMPPSFADDTADKVDIDISKVKFNDPNKLSVKSVSQGIQLTTNDDQGADWFWSSTGSVGWDNADNSAFSIDPVAHQNVLKITVTDIYSGATLLVGAFFFKGNNLLDGKNQILGSDNDGLEITAAGTYTFDISAEAAKRGIKGATGWKPLFWFSHHGAAGQTITISSISVISTTLETKSGTP